jgi:hypothetical protein
MPCYDGREAESRKLAARHHDAMTALLCGVLEANPGALTLAHGWFYHHRKIDEYRKHVKYDSDDKRIEREQGYCDTILEQAYLALCPKR